MIREKTLAILKPDVVGKHPNEIGDIIQHIIRSGLRIAAMKMVKLNKKQAQGFYHIHRERPFFDGLTHFMSSSPVLVMVLEGEDAVAKNREIIGATDSKKAAHGTIRHKYGTDVERNAIHGSDSVENAKMEIAYFFSSQELIALED